MRVGPCRGTRGCRRGGRRRRRGDDRLWHGVAAHLAADEGFRVHVDAPGLADHVPHDIAVDLDVPANVKKRLKAFTPENYIGLAESIARKK